MRDLKLRFSRISVLIAIFVAGSVLLSAAHAEYSKVREYKIKAAFLYNFAKFVEWPDGALKDTGETINLYVLGEDPFGAVLDKGIEGKSVNGRELVIKRFDRADEMNEPCQILFVGSLKDNHLPDLLKNLQDSAVLTVGETDGFTRMGGVVNFVLDGDKVRFEINVDAAEKAGLKIDSKLMGLARIVKE